MVSSKARYDRSRSIRPEWDVEMTTHVDHTYSRVNCFGCGDAVLFFSFSAGMCMPNAVPCREKKKETRA